MRIKTRKAFFTLISVMGHWSAGPGVEFASDIAPILHHHCLICHDESSNKGGYRIDTLRGIFEPGSSNLWPVSPGSLTQSHLWTLLNHPDADERMPQKSEPLPKESLQLIHQWIEDGAKLGGHALSQSLLEVIPRPDYPSAPRNYSRPYPADALEFSGDGSQLLASGVNEILVHSCDDSSPILRVGNLPQRIYKILRGPVRGGYIIAAGTPGQLGELLYLRPDLKTILTLLRCQDGYFDVCLTSDKHWLIAAEATGRIQILKWPSGTLHRSIPAHADWVTSLVARDHQGFPRVYSGSRDRSIKSFKVPEGEIELNWVNLEKPVMRLAIHPTTNTAAALLHRNSSSMLWDLEKGKRIGNLNLPTGEIACLHQTGPNLWVGGADGSLHMVDDSWRKIQKTWSLSPSPAIAITKHPHSSHMALSHLNGQISVIDTDQSTTFPTRPNQP